MDGVSRETLIPLPVVRFRLAMNIKEKEQHSYTFDGIDDHGIDLYEFDLTTLHDCVGNTNVMIRLQCDIGR